MKPTLDDVKAAFDRYTAAEGRYKRAYQRDIAEETQASGDALLDARTLAQLAAREYERICKAADLKIDRP